MKKYVLAITLLSLLTTISGWSHEKTTVGTEEMHFENNPKKKKKNTTQKETTKTQTDTDGYSDFSNTDISIAELNDILKELDEDDTLDEIHYLTEQLVNVANENLGVRYRYGGTTKNGMDCSGLVTTAFNEFNISLPRSSRDMAMVGDKVSKQQAQRGDLIFFKTRGSRISHVGIVTEVLDDEIKFIHSSTSKGVIISSTKETYYQRTFAQINRVYDKSMM